ncbi:MbnP family protein [Corallibacter sp.]|uniref:MbnP family protein n=1 Tax=Corallibacter sp. TaxID=2038084 RepID=UPI003AB1F1C3
MKILKLAFTLMLAITILSCSSDDDALLATSLVGQKGDVVIKFDNGVGDQDFIFGVNYNKSNGESYKLESLKYLISNVKLKDANGIEYVYPYDENIFIVDEADANNAGEIYITLNNVDAANYTELTFGVGIDQERYALGAEGQGDFLEVAQEEGMLWSWATGYRFTRFDGTYSSAVTTDGALNVHMGSVGTDLDNYREVTLPFPNTVRVRPGVEPQIHVQADISKVFDGETSVNFEEGYSQVHTDPQTTPVIANNISKMFVVHHVHNE